MARTIHRLARALALDVLACGERQQPGLQPVEGAAAATLAQPGATACADDGQWTMQSKDYAGWRFSGLDELPRCR